MKLGSPFCNFVGCGGTGVGDVGSLMIISSRSIVDGNEISDSASLTEQDPWGGVGVGIGSKAVSPSLDTWAGLRLTRSGISLDGSWSIGLSIFTWWVILSG